MSPAAGTQMERTLPRSVQGSLFMASIKYGKVYSLKIKNFIFLLSIFSFAVFGFTSCHKSEAFTEVSPPAAIPTASEYFPNTVGDYWEYEVYDSSAFSGIPEYSVKVTITNTVKLIDGIEANVWQYQYPWGNDTNYVRVKGDTVKIYDLTYSRTIENLQFPRQIFLIAFKEGERWNGTLYGIDTFHVTALPIIKTNFYSVDNCFKVYHHYLGPNLEDKNEYWFRENIGMVQIHYNKYSLGPVNRQLWQLQKYYLQ